MIPIDSVQYPKLVIALGGNALVHPDEAGTLEEQHRRIRGAMVPTADLVTAGFATVITHGSGPMVGRLLLQMECARSTVPPMPLFISDADTEGSLGYLIQQCLVNELHRHGKERGVITVVTQVEVSADDPAFSAPDKPIGPFYSADEAEGLQAERGWRLMEDAGRGWRRVVPVIREPNEDSSPISGVEAVIDKDRASALLAGEILADLLIFLTAVEYVYADFLKPQQRPLLTLSPAEAQQYQQEGHFAAGSMGPKIESALDFLSQGGRRVLITQPESLAAALQGQTGTHIY